MQTIVWQDNSFDSEEETQPALTASSRSKEKITISEKQACQLRKYQDPKKNIRRQEILALIENFGGLLASSNTEKIAIDLLTDDFEAFVFICTGKGSVQHYTRPQGFIDLWKGSSLLGRHVRITGVDSDKNTAWQVCEYEIIYEGDNDPAVEVACEIFTIIDKRIAKYRAFFGSPVPNINEFEKFVVPSRKDKMFAKVKEINYALAEKPDLEKISSLFNENTEFKVWRWGDHKCFTLYKTDFRTAFESMQDEMSVKSIVPYDISIDAQQKFVSGHYMYHLEERSSGKKLCWLSTCIYEFDPEANLIRIIQQGDLYPEEEPDIPFEVYSRDNLAKRAAEYAHSFVDEGYQAFYTDLVLYDCRFYKFIPEKFPNPGYYQGLKHVDKLNLIMDSGKNLKSHVFNIVDVFVDHYNESHEVVLMVSYAEVLDANTNEEEYFIGTAMLHFENGKIAKELDFMTTLSSIIQSPFDDKTFQAKNLR